MIVTHIGSASKAPENVDRLPLDGLIFIRTALMFSANLIFGAGRD